MGKTTSILACSGLVCGPQFDYPVGIGYWLDRPGMLNKSPLFTFIGLGIGTVIAFVGLIRMLFRYQAEQEEQRKNKQNKE
jgi:F0F1-type ATP synthase assembly protein I